MQVIVGISGKQYAGKDSVAAILLGQSPLLFPSYRRIGLADALKEEVAAEFGLPVYELENRKPKDAAIRTRLVELGTKRREDDSDYWVKRVLEAASGRSIVVPDVRYHNEVRAFHAAADCFFLVRVEASREARARRGLLSNETDPSETEMDSWTAFDFVMPNNDTFADLAHWTRLCAIAILRKVRDVADNRGDQLALLSSLKEA